MGNLQLILQSLHFQKNYLHDTLNHTVSPTYRFTFVSKSIVLTKDCFTSPPVVMFVVNDGYVEWIGVLRLTMMHA